MGPGRVRYLGAVLAASLWFGSAGCDGSPLNRPASAEPAPVASSPGPVVAATAGPSPSAPAVTYPEAGPRVFDVATGATPAAGRAGRLLSYQVAVERGIGGLTANTFAASVYAVLSDPRGWTATGQNRLRQVGPGTGHDFTIYLVTPATRDVLCGDGYDRYTSCRKGDAVVLNVARWVHGVPNYGASLDAYREYMINHETGHRLGRGHELCPGPGRPAPVMQQQTLGLHGCVANGWPMVDGHSYAGASGQYHDPIPTGG